MTDNEPVGPSSDPRYLVQHDDEADLREYVRVLWRYSWVIATAAVVCAALALVWGLATKRTYGAAVALVVSESKLGETRTSTALTASPFILFNSLNSEQLSTAIFRPFIENQSLAAKVVEEFGLNQPPYRFFASTFFEEVVTVEEVSDSPVFLLTAELDDPSLAARVVNRVAEMAVEMSRRVSDDEVLRSRDDIKPQMDEARKTMEEAQTRWRTFRETNLAALERQKTQLVDVRTLDAPKLTQLAELSQVESQLADLEMERDLARLVYQEVATAYQTVPLEVAGGSAQLRIIEPAVPPDRPLPRPIARNTLIALVVGLMLSVMGVLVYSMVYSTLSSDQRNTALRRDA